MFVFPRDITDINEIASRPICVVLATAIVSGWTFSETFKYYKYMKNRHKNWAGGIYKSEFRQALKDLNVKYSCVVSHYGIGKSLREFVLYNELKGDKNTYVIWNRDHAQLVNGRTICDQQGIVDIDNYWAKRRKVVDIFKIIGYKENIIRSGKAKPKEIKTMARVNTKYQKAVEVVNREQEKGTPRKEILHILVNELETTWGSASTFYHRVIRDLKKEEVNG